MTIPKAPNPGKLRQVSPAEFSAGVGAEVESAMSCIVTGGPNGAPTDHHWIAVGAQRYECVARKARGRKPAYFSPAVFVGDLTRWKGRTAANVVGVRSFWFDVEGSADKFARNPDGGYPDLKAAFGAAKAFMRATGLWVNFVVLTGSGGVHLWLTLDKALPTREWLPLARALVALAQKHGFKVDAQCTTDSARIMRAPGSLHQVTGVEVTALALRQAPYTVDEFAALVGCDQRAQPEPEAGALSVTGRQFDLSVNGDVLGSFPKYSYLQAAKVCGAMLQAAQRNGRDTPYPVWLMAISAAAKSVEGIALAHEISCGHEGYDAAAVDRKLASLTGGPPGCGAWMDAYGPGGPCESCPRGGASHA